MIETTTIVMVCEIILQTNTSQQSTQKNTSKNLR